MRGLKQDIFKGIAKIWKLHEDMTLFCILVDLNYFCGNKMQSWHDCQYYIDFFTARMRQRSEMKCNKVEKFTMISQWCSSIARQIASWKRRRWARIRISASLSSGQGMHLNKCKMTLKLDVAGIAKYLGRICDSTREKGKIQAPFTI